MVRAGRVERLVLGLGAILAVALCCSKLGLLEGDISLGQISAVLFSKDEAGRLKSSLQQITSRLVQDRSNSLGASDREQLGALVDAAVAQQGTGAVLEGAKEQEEEASGSHAETGRDLLRWVDQAGRGDNRNMGRDEVSAGLRLWSKRAGSKPLHDGCGDDCLDTLGARLTSHGYGIPSGEKFVASGGTDDDVVWPHHALYTCAIHDFLAYLRATLPCSRRTWSPGLWGKRGCGAASTMRACRVSAPSSSRRKMARWRARSRWAGSS